MKSVNRPIGESIWGAETPATKGPIPTLLPPGHASPRERERQNEIAATLEKYGDNFEGYLALERDLLIQTLEIDRYVVKYIDNKEAKELDEQEIAGISYQHAYEGFVRDLDADDRRANIQLKHSATSLVNGRQTLEAWQQIFADREATQPKQLPVDGEYFVYKTAQGVTVEDVVDTARQAVDRMDSEKLLDGLRAGKLIRRLGKMVTIAYGLEYEDKTMEAGPAHGLSLARAIVDGANKQVTEERQ